MRRRRRKGKLTCKMQAGKEGALLQLTFFVGLFLFLFFVCVCCCCCCHLYFNLNLAFGIHRSELERRTNIGESDTALMEESESRQGRGTCCCCCCCCFFLFTLSCCCCFCFCCLYHETDTALQFLSIFWLRVLSISTIALPLTSIELVRIGGVLSQVQLLHTELSDIGIRRLQSDTQTGMGVGKELCGGVFFRVGGHRVKEGGGFGSDATVGFDSEWHHAVLIHSSDFVVLIVLPTAARRVENSGCVLTESGAVFSSDSFVGRVTVTSMYNFKP